MNPAENPCVAQVSPHMLEFYLNGERLVEGGSYDYRIPVLRGLTNPVALPLDIHNPCDAVCDSSSMELGVVLPDTLSARVDGQAVRLPDGRVMHLFPTVSRVLPGGWKPLRIGHWPRGPRRGKSGELACALRVHDQHRMREIVFTLQTVPAVGSMQDASSVEGQARGAPARLDPYDASLPGTFLSCVLEYWRLNAQSRRYR